MPIFVDRHDLTGMTPADIAELHVRDLEIQDRYGVRFLTYWFDDARKTGFCLIEAPDAETAMRVHEQAHGGRASDVVEADLSAVEAFLGRIGAPEGGDPEAPICEPGFRAVLFTDIVGSTEMTAELGDSRAVELVRAHDSLVRRALADHGGREVKHTGDGIMASFPQPRAAVDCARTLQRALAAFSAASDVPLRVRVGIHAGEPVEEGHDLFGATVQLAARLCADAEPETILVSERVRDDLPAELPTRDRGRRRLKGFSGPVTAYEVPWR